ncbi:MAG TPA: thiamine pyrophosphate-binding protein [Ktedonobacterales bacterium]|nr:thiamine pyrophosphate-binding protein [Ktedonobacterales bacterium]
MSERSSPDNSPGERTQYTGAQILCDALEQEGVDVLFGYPGGAIMPFYDALTASSLRHVLVRHEQAAAHAADGYARATGRVGVCVATSGPGATNLVTGLATAFMDSYHVLVGGCRMWTWDDTFNCSRICPSTTWSSATGPPRNRMNGVGGRFSGC